MDNDAIGRTKDCPRDFVCLSSGPYCKVIACMDEDLHFILCGSDLVCVFKKTFRGRTICTCPTRKRLFDRDGR